MIGEKMDSQEILNRLMTAYGVSSQKSLAEALAIPANNISGWLQRGSVPGNPIIKCALDTGADLEWLMTGKFANANVKLFDRSKLSPALRGKQLLDRMLASGGKPVLSRILSAYGFKTQKELSEYFGISTGTISTWIRREFFPADMVIACTLDTGVSLRWISTGVGEPTSESGTEVISQDEFFRIPQEILHLGRFESRTTLVLDKSLMPKIDNPEGLIFIKQGQDNWLVNLKYHDISDGLWVLNIDGVKNIYSIIRKPGNKINVSSNGKNYDCYIKDIEPVGVIIGGFTTY